jgi:hypothetical protein
MTKVFNRRGLAGGAFGGFYLSPHTAAQGPVPDPADMPLRADGCPEQHLSDYLASPGARLISAVIDLDFALRAGMSVSFDKVGYPEFLILRQLFEQRDKWETEEINKKKG